MDLRDFIKSPRVEYHALEDDGEIPNNHTLPLLIYQDALDFLQSDPAKTCVKVFASNCWGRSWRNGIYPFHHYHSTAHEVLGVCRGVVKVQFGGEKGVILSVRPGDVVVIPAGVGHKNLGSSPNLCVVGAYPAAGDWDMCYGKKSERAHSLGNISRVSLPSSDPVYGTKGPLFDHWKS